MKLTQNYVNTVKSSTRLNVYDDAFKGLFLCVFPSGKKSYYLKFEHNTKSIKLGNAAIISPSQAREKAQEFLASYTMTGSDPREVKRKDITLENLLKEYKDAGESTYIHDRVESAFASELKKPLSFFTLLWVKKWQKNYLETGKRKIATANKCTSSLKTLFNWAKTCHLIVENPLAELKKQKEVDSDTKTRYLTDDERTRLFAALDERETKIREARHRTLVRRPYLPDLDTTVFADYLKPLIIVALNTGIRKTALLSLRWEDVNLERGEITLLATNAKNKETKILPINQTVVQTLKDWHRQTPGDLVWPSPHTGKKIDNYDKAWRDVLKAAGIEHFRRHDMRHDFASQLVMKGVDLNTVRELMTHSDMDMTLRYAHLAPSKTREAVNL